MNLNAANALLKTLEEPCRDTLLLLVATQPRRLPATILSRCCRQALPAPAVQQAAEWLAANGVHEPALLLAQSGGAPLTALSLAEANQQEERRRLLDGLAGSPDASSMLDLAAALQRTPLATVLRWLATWCYDLLCSRLTRKIRYAPDYLPALEALADRVSLDRLLVFADELKAAQDAASHPLNQRLLLEHLLLSYSHAVRVEGR